MNMNCTELMCFLYMRRDVFVWIWVTVLCKGTGNRAERFSIIASLLFSTVNVALYVAVDVALNLSNTMIRRGKPCTVAHEMKWKHLTVRTDRSCVFGSCSRGTGIGLVWRNKLWKKRTERAPGNRKQADWRRFGSSGWLVWEGVTQSVSVQVSKDYKWTSLTSEYRSLLTLLHMYKQFIRLEQTNASFYFVAAVSTKTLLPFFSLNQTPSNTLTGKNEKNKEAYPGVHHIQSQHAAHLCNNLHEDGLMHNRIMKRSMQMSVLDAYWPACGWCTVLR